MEEKSDYIQSSRLDNEGRQLPYSGNVICHIVVIQENNDLAEDSLWGMARP